MKAILALAACACGIGAAGNAQNYIWQGDASHTLAATYRPTSMEARILAVHNAARAQVGVDPLQWDPKLAADAAEWAQHLADTGRFEHDNEDDDEKNEGENLFEGTRGAFPVERMVGYWEDEKKDFRPGRFPDVSPTKGWEEVGHYTQMVWRDTDEVGCAIGRNRRDDILVCRYSQPGNVEGERVF